ncbi:hypothetical protein HDU96_009346 [Phlyctochytrium bullatum]|nr:hypothetical protein HDU96_009346 [Phlyctochytrium bullatum]
MPGFAPRRMLASLAITLLAFACAVVADPVTLLFVPPVTPLVPGQPVTITWSLNPAPVTDPTAVPPPNVFQSPGTIDIRVSTAPAGVDGVAAVVGVSIEAGTAQFVLPTLSTGRVRLFAFQAPGAVQDIFTTVIAEATSSTSTSAAITSSTISSAAVASASPTDTPAAAASPSSSDTAAAAPSPSPSPSASPVPTATAGVSGTNASPSPDPFYNNSPTSPTNENYFANGAWNRGTIAAVAAGVTLLVLVLVASTVLCLARRRAARNDEERFRALAKKHGSEFGERSGMVEEGVGRANRVATAASSTMARQSQYGASSGAAVAPSGFAVAK